TLHTIANSLTQLGNGVQVAMPVNLGGACSAALHSSYGLPVKNLLSVVTLSGRLAYSQTPNLLNGLVASSQNTNVSLSLSTSTAIADKLDLMTNANAGYNVYRYPFQAGQQPDFFSAQATGIIRWYLGCWTISVNAAYQYNGNLSPGFKKGTLLLSPAVEVRLFKHKAGNIKLFVFDLLNQNSGISRTVDGNLLQESSAEVRGRFGMVSFSYDIRRFGKKKP
ncbi:MAG TPA: outer membrane beta-barrel protein, partial [Dinghuibacter sp.]|uniref:outer membrane beta-barrel protein n=1 Tax=Dinghuibacter sp. TaxID=2024697 RepID=UPI002C47102C